MVRRGKASHGMEGICFIKVMGHIIIDKTRFGLARRGLVR